MVGACPFPVPQGSQVLLRDVALSMRSDGHEVHLVVYGYGKGEDTSGLRVHRCPRLPFAKRIAAGPSLAKPFLDMLMVTTLLRVVREQKIDIIHAHNYEGLLVSLCARKISLRSHFPPIVYHTHNVMSDELPYYFGQKGLAQKIGTWLDRTFPRQADHVIAHHQGLAEYLETCGCDSGAVSVIAPPVNVSLFERSEISEAIPPVVYAGNLDAYQNLSLLSRAVELVKKVEPDVRLIIATSQKKHIPKAEIIPTPDFDSLRNVLSMDCIFACPRVSWSGYPIKLLNAMAAGKAVVACRNAAHPITDGHDGIIVPDNDEDEFAEAILRLLRNAALRENLGCNAHNTMIEKHLPEQIALQTEQLYSGLLEKQVE